MGRESGPDNTKSPSWTHMAAATSALFVGIICVAYFAVSEVFSRFPPKSELNDEQQQDETPNDEDISSEPDFQTPISEQVGEIELLLSDTTIPIYFASQSGTAENFAGEVAKTLTSFQLKSEVIDLENFDFSSWVGSHPVRFAVLVLATYGEGEAPDNAARFDQWLSSSNRPADCLSHLSYAMMGLGNRQYTHFNGMSRRTNMRMQQLGAQCVCTVGEGDDDQDIESHFLTWLGETFKPTISRLLDSNSQEGLSTEGSPSVSPAVSLKVRSAWRSKPRAPLDVMMGDSAEQLLEKYPNPKDVVGCDLVSKMHFTCGAANVVLVRNLLEKSEDSQRAVRHIEMQLQPLANGQTPSFCVADNLDVFPANIAADVRWFMDRLVEVDAEGNVRRVRDKEFVQFVERPSIARNGRPFPTPCRVIDAITHHVELGSLPMKSTLRDFALCMVTDDDNKKKLEDLLDGERTKTFKEYIKDARFTLREFVELLMPSALLDVGGFLQLTARQRPRSYTICTSPVVDPLVAGLTVTRLTQELAPLISTTYSQLASESLLSKTDVEEWKAADASRSFRGVASTYLCGEEFAPDTVTRVAIRTSSFRHIQSGSNLTATSLASQSIIMICAGTGIAPFRGFIQHWAAQQRTTTVSAQKKNPTRILFFGCRREDEDFLYKREIETAVASGVLTRCVVAYSRQSPKQYVQDKLAAHIEEIEKVLVHEGGQMMVSGATRMGKSVVDNINSLFVGRSFLRSDEEFVSRLKQESRYIEELWTD